MASDENENQNGTELEKSDDGWKVNKNTKSGLGRKKGSKSLYFKTPVKFTPALKKRFLKYLAEGYDRTSASAKCGISRHTFYLAVSKDQSFRNAVEVATEMGNSQWEEEAINRIKKGSKTVEKDADGNIIKTITKDNDALLMKMLEARKNETYGKKQTNVNIHQDSSSSSAIDKLASLLGVTVDRGNDPIDITDADYEEKN